MYCPKCAADNPQNGRFCRQCGTDISFVRQALVGTVPQSGSQTDSGLGQVPGVGGSKGKVQKPASVYKGITNLFRGIGFLLVAAAVFRFAPAGKLWWFWLLIPAFGALGSGVAEMLRAKHEEHLLRKHGIPPVLPEVYRAGELPAGVDYGMQPPSITERTMRVLRVPSDQ